MACSWYLKIDAEGFTEDEFQEMFKHLAQKVAAGNWNNLSTGAASGGAGQPSISYSVHFRRGVKQRRGGDDV